MTSLVEHKAFVHLQVSVLGFCAFQSYPGGEKGRKLLSGVGSVKGDSNVALGAS